MNLINPKVPTSFGEGWLSYYATSSYQIPSDLIALMDNDIKTEYSTGDALIKLVKNKDYCLTSVQSPRLDGFERWKNITLEKDISKYENTHLYTKSFNERFHGTTFFQPGVFCYQQHMFSAALSNEALVFINQPGGACDSSSMRPGYWYGNGIMPAVKQEGNLLSAIYSIPDNYPLQFSHVFFPKCKFDEIRSEGNWRFVRKNDGYLALWCSTDLVEYNEELSDCEIRSYSSLTGYLLLVGSKEEYKDFIWFINNAKSINPVFNTVNKAMSIYGKVFNQFLQCKDETQYV